MRLFSALVATLALMLAPAFAKAADPMPKIVTPVQNDNVAAFTGFLVEVSDNFTTGEFIVCRVTHLESNTLVESSFAITDGSGTAFLTGSTLGSGTYEIFVYGLGWTTSDSITVNVP